jgi:hypothetical protein
MTAIRTPVLCAAIALNAAISVWASAALAAEPIVFIVSYHNLDYAKVACEHALQFEPDARNTMRNAEQFKWQLSDDDTNKNILAGQQNADRSAIRESWDAGSKTSSSTRLLSTLNAPG